MATNSHLMDNSSEPLFDFFCELCKDDGKQLEAEGYCVDCGDYLCKTCFEYHRRSRPTRHHELLDKERMPKNSPLPSEPISKDIWSKCQKHRGKPIEYYCKNHKILGCSVCFTMDHRGCQNVDYIPDVSDQLLDTKEFLEFKSNLSNMAQKANAIGLMAKENIEKAEQYFNKSMESMKVVREEINKTLNEIESKLREQLEKIRSEDIQKMKHLTTKSESLLNNVEKIASEIQKLETSGKVCQLYISKIQFEPEILALLKTAFDTEAQACVREYKFKPNENVSSVLKSGDFLGTSMVVEGMNIGESCDVLKSLVSSSVVLSKNKLVIIDHFNQRVKLVDPLSKTVLSALNLGMQLWDVTAINENQLVVTTGENQKLVYLKISPRLDLQVQKQVDVTGNCRGIAHRDNRLFISFVKPTKLEVMDMNDKVLATIRKDNNNRSYFRCPEYVCISKDGKYIYVSDYHQSGGKVVRMTIDGVIDNVYSDKSLRGVQKVCLDDEGNLLVCGYHSKNVLVITAECQKKGVIINQENGLNNDVYSVSYCCETKCVYVGMKSDVMIVFKSETIRESSV